MLDDFFNQPVVVETPLGPVAGVLVGADRSERGGLGSLLVHRFAGFWILIVS
jgi:hypothetical protein